MKVLLIYFLTGLVTTSALVAKEATSYLEEPAIAVIMSSDVTTLYSEMGWNYEKYESVKSVGASLPDKVAFPKRGQKAYVVESRTLVYGDRYQQFSRISYEKNGKKITGWVADEHFEQDMNALDDPENFKTVADILGTEPDPNNKRNPIGTTEADFCDGNCDEAKSQLSNFGEYISAVGSFKNSEELEWYTNLYRQRRNKSCVDTHHQNFVNEYQQYIQVASKEFGVPEALLTCVIFRESQFDPHAKSYTGVEGIAQMDGDTIERINNIISRLDKDSRNHISEKGMKKLEKVISCGQDMSKWKSQSECDLLTKYPLKQGEKRAVKIREQYDYAKAEVELLLPLAKRWRSYYEKLDKLEVYDKFKKEHYRNYEIPTRFTKEKGNQWPPNAIAASALLLKETLEGIEEGSGSKLNASEAKDAALLATIAYNAGPSEIYSRAAGGNTSSCRATRTCKPSEWLDDIKSSYQKQGVDSAESAARAHAKYKEAKAKVNEIGKVLKKDGMSEEDMKKHPEYKRWLDKKWIALEEEKEENEKRAKAREVLNHVNSLDNCMSKSSNEPPNSDDIACDYVEVSK